MRSMTGYGRGEAVLDGLKFTVELNSINRKQCDISVNLPKELIELEPRIRDEINGQLSRGRINAVVVYHRSDSKGKGHVELDIEVAQSYYRAIKDLQKRIKIGGTPDIDTILRAPGVMRLSEVNLDPKTVWPSVELALKKGLSQLVSMREKEGKHLCADLVKRLDEIGRGTKRIRKLVPQTIKRHREQLLARIKTAGLELPHEDDRILKEVLFFADRCDVTEELTRLESHLSQFRGQLNSKEPVGRTLDFLSQEINRELNTIGSKSNDVDISQQVVKLKAELEKIREQIQNVE